MINNLNYQSKFKRPFTNTLRNVCNKTNLNFVHYQLQEQKMWTRPNQPNLNRNRPNKRPRQLIIIDRVAHGNAAETFDWSHKDQRPATVLVCEPVERVQGSNEIFRGWQRTRSNCIGSMAFRESEQRNGSRRRAHINWAHASDRDSLTMHQENKS